MSTPKEPKKPKSSTAATPVVSSASVVTSVVNRDAEIVARRQNAMNFYEQSLDKIPDAHERDWRRSQLMNEVSGIDHTKASEVMVIKAGTIFQQRQGEVWTKGFYFSEVGISPSEVGIAESGAITGYPKEFTTLEFIQEYNRQHRDVIQATEDVGQELSDDELRNLHLRNAEIAKKIAIEIGVRHGMEEAQTAIEQREGRHRDLTEAERHTVETDVTTRIQKLRVPEGKELPIIKYSDLKKPMRLYVVTKDTEVFVSHAKGTEPGAAPLMDTWSRLRAAGDERSALVNRTPVPVPVKGGAVQYYSVETEHFHPVLMTTEEYLKKVKANPEIIPPKPEDLPSDMSKPAKPKAHT